MQVGSTNGVLDALALVRDCPEDFSLGTNIDETLHSTLRSDATLSGRKGYNTYLTKLEMSLKRFNYGVLNSIYRPHGRERIGYLDSALQMTRDVLKDMLQDTRDNVNKEFLTLF